MKVEITRPMEVSNNVKKTYGTAAVYADCLAEYERTARSVALAVEEVDGLLAQDEREAQVFLDSLQRYTGSEEESRETENQRRMCIERLERIRERRRKVQGIRDEAYWLVKEAADMKNHASNLAQQWKTPVLKVSALINAYLRAL